MDLKQLDVNQAANKGAVLELRNPYDGEILTYDKEGEQVPMFLRVLGKDSDAYRQGFRKLVNKRMRKAKRSGGAAKLEEIEKDTLRQLAACVVGGKIFIDGREVEVDESVAYELMDQDGYAWIREQVEEFQGDRSNFLHG